ncbi:MAG TPA: TonB-dependent receptor [Candidatus Acidoferrum sp.]|nr:TonB-dependent receptor [Candidatus Acidoferrum sp.]
MSISANAQAPTASVVGTVLDPQGLPVEGATVTLTNQGTNYSYNTTSSSAGAFRFDRLDAAVYRVAVEAAGFRAAVVENIKLDVAADYSVPPIKLEVGSAKESITVEAGAEVVNTTDTEVSSTVEKKQIEALPILDRNPLNLLSLQAGVNASAPSNGSGPTDTVIGGQRSSYSNLTLDGINIQDNFIRENALDFSPNLPFSSQAAEFTVINQNAGVENGGGSSQVAIVTPRGTNTWHGQGFWNYRTNAWAANDWFNDASGTPNPNLLRNQGGGNVGGPILKDKLFIYGWYELLRLRQQAVNNTTVISPTIFNALNGTGALPAACGGVSPCLPFTYTPVDPNTGNSDPGGPQTINLLNFTSNAGQNFTYAADPAMLALIQRVPAAKFNNTRVGDGVNLLGYQLNARSNDTRDNYGFRVDYNLNNHNTITGTWAWNRQIVDRPDIDTSYNTVPLVSNNNSEKFLSIGWRWSPTGTITNEARFGFNLAPGFFLTNQKFGNYIVDQTDPTSGATLVPFTLPDPNFLPQGRNTRTWTGLDNASFTKGNHTIKFGGSVTRITIATDSRFGFYPEYLIGFSTANTDAFQASDMPGSTTTYSGSSTDYANAAGLLTSVAGILSGVQQTFNATSQTSGFKVAPQDRNYRQNQFALYAGDSWRVNPKLTVNYGLRWDYLGPIDERDGLVLLPVVPAGQNVHQTLLSDATVDFAGGNSKRGLYGGYWKAFSPNIGIAWDPFGNGKTAIRAGFSINYVNDEFFTAADNAAGGNAGLSFTGSNGELAGPTVSNPMGAETVQTPPFGIPTTFSTNAINAIGPNFQGNIGSQAGYGIDPNLKPPQIQQWNLSVQRDIGWNTSLQLSYVGNHGVGLFRAIDVNQLNFNAPATCPAGFPKACPTDTFFQDFQDARARGFAALAANQPFDPAFGCPKDRPGPTCLPFFNYIYGGAIGVPFINSFIQQGQIGELIHIYHTFGFDTDLSGLPGPGNIVNWFPNPFIEGGDLLKNTSFSNYNAGIVEVRRRFSRGLYFQANYTFSKVMTNYGPSNNNDQSRFNPVQDNARPFLERQRAPFDLTHAFKANFTYELPIGKGHRLLGSPGRALGLLVNGWQTGSIFTWQSGAPFSIVSQYATFNRGGSRSVNNTAIATLTHSQISGDIGVFERPGGVVYIINPKLISPDGTGAPSSPQLGGCTPAVAGGFCNPQPGEVGNLQLYAFDAPSYFAWNITASKNFDITEKVKLNFRTDAFNLTNHPVFAVPLDSFSQNANFNINDPTFGQSTRTISAPRVLQMQLQLTF